MKESESEAAESWEEVGAEESLRVRAILELGVREGVCMRRAGGGPLRGWLERWGMKEEGLGVEAGSILKSNGHASVWLRNGDVRGGGAGRCEDEGE